MPFVRTPPTMFEHMQASQDPIRQAAEAREMEFASALLAVWGALDGSVDGVQRFEEQLESLPVRFLDAWRAGFEEMYRAMPVIRKETVGFSFERVAPATQEAADTHAARLVREIGDDLRMTINQTTQDGIAAGLGPEEMGVQVRNGLGLTRWQARAVQNYRAALLAQSPEALAYRLRDHRFDPTVEAAIDAKAPLAPQLIDRMVEKYRTRFLNHRALTIARFETLFASNSGAQGAIRDAMDKGLMPPTTRARWLIAHDERTCPMCRSIPRLQPAGVPVGAMFRWETPTKEGRIAAPPGHPACRCSISYLVGAS